MEVCWTTRQLKTRRVLAILIRFKKQDRKTPKITKKWRWKFWKQTNCMSIVKFLGFSKKNFRLIDMNKNQNERKKNKIQKIWLQNLQKSITEKFLQKINKNQEKSIKSTKIYGPCQIWKSYATVRELNNKKINNWKKTPLNKQLKFIRKFQLLKSQAAPTKSLRRFFSQVQIANQNL